MEMILQWTNKVSREQGYVMSLNKKEGHFENTYEAENAKVFKRQCDVTRTLNSLEAFGETVNNDFTVIEK